MATASVQPALALRNILVATDFSPSSDRALLHAVAAAHHFGSTLHLLHIVKTAPFCMLPPDAYIDIEDAIDGAQRRARLEAEVRLNVILRKADCQYMRRKIWIQHAGAVAETLCAFLEREYIDLVVLGTHGRTGLRKLMAGSVAEQVFRHASCPVLTVGPQSWRSDPRSVHLSHILFPTDLSPESMRALPITIAIANDFGASLSIMSIVPEVRGEATHDECRAVSTLDQRMRKMTSAFGLPAKTTFEVRRGEVSEVVLEAIDAQKVDLILFGLKAPDTRSDRLPWIHAYKIVCEASCPVLSLRGPSSEQH